MIRSRRRVGPAALALLSSLGACGRGPDPGRSGEAAPAGSILVEEVAPGSSLARAGLEPGDRLLTWRRGAASGRITGFDDLDEVEREQAPRGPVTLVVERGGHRLEVEIPVGRWRARSRPALGAALASDPDPEELRRRREATDDGVVAAWLSWRLAVAGGKGSAQEWERALEAARAAADRGLEAWLERERCAELQRAMDLDPAERACERSAALRRELEEPLAAREVEYHLARLAGRRGEPAEEERRFRALVDALEREAPGSLLQARALQGLGKARATQGDYAGALEHARRALALVERRAPGGLDHQAAHMVLGIFHWFREEWDEAEASLARAIELLEAIDPEHEDMANALNNLGIVRMARGDLAGAEEAYRRSLEIRRRVAPDPLQESRTLNNLGSIAQLRGDREAGIAYDRRVLELRERLAPDSIDAATPALNLGERLVEAGELDEAERLLARALELFRRHAPDSEDVARALSVLGELERRRGDPQRAEARLRAALAAARRSHPGSTVEARIERALGEVLRERNDAEGAERLLRRAVERLVELVPGTVHEALARHALGSLLRGTGRRVEALAELRRAAAALDRQFGLLGGTDEVRARFRESWRHVYRDLADLLLELGRPDEAFEVLEHSRARAFLFLLRAREIELSARLPEALEREREAIGAAYDALQERIGERSAAGDRPGVERLVARRRELERRRDRLAERIGRAAPRLAELDAALDARGASAALGPGVAAISYSVGESSSRAWILADGSGPRVVELAVGEAELRELVDRFRLLLETAAPAARPEPLGRRLYELLVAPAEPELGETERLVLVPDGPLHHLPFAALVRSGENEEPRFLVERRSIQVAASVTAWVELLRRRTEGDELVAFADPAPPSGGVALAGLRGGPPAPLPGSRREAERIAAGFGSGARILAGAEASEPAAKRIGREARLLHFATHAIVDRRSPLDSALLLAPGRAPSGRRENGLLQAWEVLQELRLEAELVTLSACETGRGALVADEGILGLTRAFHFAGARAVLSSLWKVADRQTAELMAEFYDRLLDGLPADEALRRAQIELLRRPGSHPSHWAAFQLYGAAAGPARSPAWPSTKSLQREKSPVSKLSSKKVTPAPFGSARTISSREPPWTPSRTQAAI